MTADEFCRGMNDDVSAVLDGSDEVRCAEGVVDDERQAVRVSDFGESVDIGYIAVGIAEGLDVDRLGVRLYRRGDLLQIVNVNEGRVDAVERQCMRQQVSRAAVDGFLSYDMLAFGCESLDRISYRSCAGSESKTRYAALQSRDPFLKNALCGISESAVDVARVRESETVCGVLGVMEYI